jgi:curli biogenesis system outer membrane secretion channel CsgG
MAIRFAAVIFLAILAATGAGTTARPASAETPGGNPSGYHGPKKTIAVAKFTAHEAFLARYGGYDVGGGLAAQIATALARSPYFVVVERPDLGHVASEQELALAGHASGPTAARSGRLLGAQLLVVGAVTEFNENDKGGGFSVGFAGINGLGGALSPRSKVGHVSIDVRVIDATTGRIVAAHSVDQAVKKRSIGLRVTGQKVGFDGDAFNRTALGKATRGAIEEAVAFLEQSLAEVPWQASVAKVEANQVYINAGQNADLHVGDELAVYRIIDRVVDPFTREVLGSEEALVGTLRIESIAARYAVGTFDGATPAFVSDHVRMARAKTDSNAAY